MPVSVAVMVVLIVLITAVSKVTKARYEALGRHQATTVGSADAARVEHDIRQLKDRIQVLERVITDNHQSVGLDREIERLRDR